MRTAVAPRRDILFDFQLNMIILWDAQMMSLYLYLVKGSFWEATVLAGAPPSIRLPFTAALELVYVVRKNYSKRWMKNVRKVQERLMDGRLA